MPRVEDMTGFSITGPCRHPILFFGSGGYYVICSNCSQMWVAKTPDLDAAAADFVQDPAIQDGDRRVDPDYGEGE